MLFLYLSDSNSGESRDLLRPDDYSKLLFYCCVLQSYPSALIRKKYISKKDALLKLQRYCAYQDRCHQEVRRKLRDLGIYGDDLEEIIVELIGENFLNEERYARSYARGKFRVKKWGRDRIRQELKKRNISAYCLRKGLEEIEESLYLDTLREVILKRNTKTTAKTEFERGAKLGQYALSRGYESALVWNTIRQLREEGLLS